MELTLKRLLEQAKFTTTRKGYDQDEVDDFLDRAVAMATKVEARLTQALAESKSAGDGAAAPAVDTPAGRSEEDVQAEIAAEVDKRVRVRVSELEAEAAKAAKAIQDATKVDVQRSPDSDDAAATEAARTLVLAQRTADAAVAEAREEAETIVAKARAEAEELSQRTTDEVEAERRANEAEVAQARSEARARLSEEISRLEQAREGLRADLGTLESHVESQRTQVRGALEELQRLLDDPQGFRLAPAPASAVVEIPDISHDDGSEGDVDLTEESPVSPVVPESSSSAASSTFASTSGATSAIGSAPAAGAAQDDPEQSDDTGPTDLAGSHDAEPNELHHGSIGDRSATTTPDPAGEEITDLPFGFAAPAKTSPQDRADALSTVGADDVDPGERSGADGFPYSGPPTAPVSAIELDFDAPSIAPQGTDDGDDAFLEELRKAMADESPLGPREDLLPGGESSFLDDDKRGWRFGKRR